MVVLSASIEQKYVFASDLSSAGRGHVAFLFTYEEQKTAATCST